MRGGLGNRRLLERAQAKAAILTTDFYGGTSSGRLNPDQANRFIDYIVDNQVIMKEGIRVVRMVADRTDLDKITVGSRIIRLATEGTAPTDLVGITTSKRQLEAREIILPVDVSFSTYEDNIEKAALENHLLKMFGTQLGNDLEDLAIVGDDSDGDPFIGIDEGWLEILRNDVTTNVFDTSGSTDMRNVVLPGMLAALPVRWKGNKAALRYFTSVTNEERYKAQISQRQTALGDTALINGVRAMYDGVPVVGVPYMPDTRHILTIPDNLVFGIHRDITMGQFRHERKRVVEYTWTIRSDYQVVEPPAAVLGYDAP